MHREIGFDPDAFPRCRGAEDEATRVCCVGVSESETLAPPPAQSDVRIPPSSSATAHAAPAMARVRDIPRLSNQARARGGRMRDSQGDDGQHIGDMRAKAVYLLLLLLVHDIMTLL